MILAEMDALNAQITEMEGKLKALYLQRLRAQQQPTIVTDPIFEREYIKKRFDYRCHMDMLPLPAGKACHIQYQKDIETMRTSMASLLKEADEKRTELANVMEGEDESKLIADLNFIMDRYHNTESTLFHLLQTTQPIDAEQFHKTFGDLLRDRMQALQETRIAEIKALHLC